MGRIGRNGRHWPWVLAALVAVLCTGIVAVPVAWAFRLQVQADRGEVSPEAAVTVYVTRGLSAGDQTGWSGVLAPGERRDELLRQLSNYRAEMSRYRLPSKIDTVSPFNIERNKDRATVTIGIRPEWWGEDGGYAMMGTPHEWRFDVRRDRAGWRIWSVEMPEWCGEYIRADRCA